MEDYVNTIYIITIRKNCLQFYLTTQKIHKRLSITNDL